MLPKPQLYETVSAELYAGLPSTKVHSAPTPDNTREVVHHHNIGWHCRHGRHDGRVAEMRKQTPEVARLPAMRSSTSGHKRAMSQIHGEQISKQQAEQEVQSYRGPKVTVLVAVNNLICCASTNTHNKTDGYRQTRTGISPPMKPERAQQGITRSKKDLTLAGYGGMFTMVQNHNKAGTLS